MGKGLWTGRSEVRRVFLLVLLAAALYFVGRVLAPFFPALAWAAILATIFFPFYKWILRYIRNRELAGALTSFFLLVAIVLPVLFFAFLMVKESVRAYGVVANIVVSGLPAKVAALQNSSAYQAVTRELGLMGVKKTDLGTAVARAFSAGSRFLIEHSALFVSGFMTFVLQLFVMLLALYHFFLRGPQILRELRTLIPLRSEYEEQIIQKFKDVVHATFTGSLAVAVVQGALGGLGFLIFGVPSPVVWGAAMGLVSLVPVVGTALVWGPVVIFYLLSGSILKGLLMLLVFGGAVGSVDNILRPILVRRGLEISTFWVFISIIGGLGVFGFLGFVLGPLVFVILVVLIEAYKVEFRGEGPEETAS